MRLRVLGTLIAAFAVAAAAAAQLPSVTWTCPMHPDVIEDKKASCPICAMDLEPIRLVSVYTCPVHAIIEQESPGACRVCGRALVARTMSMTFTCRGDRSVAQLEPGTCRDGSPTVKRYAARAHGDHNPKHGGVFFMAPDNWHHLEGSYPADGRFRLYVYDDFSRPLAPGKIRALRGRIVTRETFDPKTGIAREVTSAPLVPDRTGAFLEARIERLPLPARMTAKIRFDENARESRFDFAFTEYSKTPSAGSPPAARAATSLLPANTPAPAAAPGTSIAALRARVAEIETLVNDGALGAIYVPALQAKDLALDLQAASTADERADAIEQQVRQIVIAAYQLDNFGDLGDGNQVRIAFEKLRSAVTRLESLVGSR